MQKNNNIVKAINKNVRSSPRKISLVLDHIRGKKVDAVLRDLDFIRKRISKDVKMDKDEFHITREEWNKKVTSWEVMSDNTIVDSSHRYTLIVYSHEEWNNLGSDYESDYDIE